MANNDKSRYHAEVKLFIGGRDCRINVFADSLQEVFNDIATIVDLFPLAQAYMPNRAKGEIENAERLAASIPPPAPTPTPLAPAPKPPAKPPAPAPTPTPNHNKAPECAHCGNNLFMELISFTDKKTGAPRQAWKCQECEEWHFPPKR